MSSADEEYAEFPTLCWACRHPQTLRIKKPKITRGSPASLAFGNPVDLLPFDAPKDRPGDRRNPPGGPPRLGDQVTLCFRTPLIAEGCADFEHMAVDVTDVEAGGVYRGVVAGNPTALLTPHDVMAKGSVIRFRTEHVYDFDPPDPRSPHG
ncbi:MAG: hypothetical protein JWO38_6384 [Gemmataceae bacterium]|nr:hypothetical protein [Gemmataceae bacterium]